MKFIVAQAGWPLIAVKVVTWHVHLYMGSTCKAARGTQQTTMLNMHGRPGVNRRVKDAVHKARPLNVGEDY